jgi:hypothetical protein
METQVLDGLSWKRLPFLFIMTLCFMGSCAPAWIRFFEKRDSGPVCETGPESFPKFEFSGGSKDPNPHPKDPATPTSARTLVPGPSPWDGMWGIFDLSV